MIVEYKRNIVPIIGQINSKCYLFILREFKSGVVKMTPSLL